MEEQVQKSNAGKVLGIISFILSIIALLVSIIPLLGTIGIFIAAPAIILALIAFFVANKNKGKKGLIITAIIISFLANCASGWQLYVGMQAKSMIENEVIENMDKVDTQSLEDELNGIMNESMDSLNGTVNQMQNGLDSLSDE